MLRIALQAGATAVGAFKGLFLVRCTGKPYSSRRYALCWRANDEALFLDCRTAAWLPLPRGRRVIRDERRDEFKPFSYQALRDKVGAADTARVAPAFSEPLCFLVVPSLSLFSDT